MDVLVKVDVGFHRCGIDPDAAGAAEFVAAVAELPGLRFRGLLSHAGHAYGALSDDEVAAVAGAEARVLTALAERVRNLGVPVEEISVGATPTARFSAKEAGITELRPGNYIYYDRTQVALGAATWDDCALTVLARRRQAPARSRHPRLRQQDADERSARGAGNPAGYGVVLTALDAAAPDESLLIERLSEEHATVRVRTPRPPNAAALEPGDLVRIVPNHSCVVSNLVDQVWLVDGDEVLEPMDVSARGRIA